MPEPSARQTAGVRRVLPLLAALAAALVVGGLLESSLASVHYMPGADEGRYLSAARTLSVAGPAGLADATRAYLDSSDAGLFPSPTRVGFLAPAALALRLFGDDFRALSQVSVAAHLLLMLSSFAFARRRVGAWRALGLATLLGSAPLLLGLARRALADSLVTLLLSLALWCLLEALRPTHGAPGSKGWLGAFAVAFCAAVLAKESAVLFLVPLGAVALVEHLSATHPVPWPRLAAALLVPLAVAMLVWTALAGSPSGVYRLASATLRSPAQNPYAVDFGSGPWTRYVVDFLLLSPWSTLLAVAGAGTLALRRSPDEPHRALARDLCWFAGGALAVFAPLTKNVRYLAILEIPIAVLAMLFLSELLLRRLGEPRRGLAAVLVTLVVVGLALAGLRSAERLFVEAGIYDPVTSNLLRALQMVPGR